TTPPIVGQPTTSVPRIGDKDSGGCAATGTTTVITVKVSDPESGLQTVLFNWRNTQTGAQKHKAMTIHSNGTATVPRTSVPLGIAQALYAGFARATNKPGLTKDGQTAPAILSVYDCS